ncbi:MAG: PAS domain-containing protein [Gammaproteobacteria bacterium]|nr:PAS domain-containing protein [Gammaproteobacteria bacterium]NNK99666.1 PAS domain-containing protein [Xanthomonadales bacterium]
MDIQIDNFKTGDPAFAVNLRGVIAYWNSAAEQSLGHTSDEAVGSKCWQLLRGQDSNGNRYCAKHCPVREMASQREPIHSFLCSFVSASSKPRKYSVSCLNVDNDSGDKLLLHICQPANKRPETVTYQVPIDEHAEPLSQREAEVLSLLADEVSTQDIADRMDISIRTVRTHIQHLMYKLRVHKRHDAIHVARQLKLI